MDEFDDFKYAACSTPVRLKTINPQYKLVAINGWSIIWDNDNSELKLSTLLK